MNKNSKLAYTLLGIVFIIFNLISLVVPTTKTFTFWISYCFTVIAFSVQIFIWNLAFKNANTLKSKFLGFPIIYVGVIFLVIQLLAFAVFMIFPTIAYWISLIFCSSVLGVSAICLITVEVGRDEIIRIENKIQDKVFFIKELQCDIELLADKCPRNDCKAELMVLAEKIKYSDPMSSEQLYHLETEIKNRADELKSLDGKFSIQQIIDIETLIDERNKKCKILK